VSRSAAESYGKTISRRLSWKISLPNSEGTLHTLCRWGEKF